MTEYKSIQFEVIECYKCHVQFCVTAEHKQQLIDSKEGFFCPNGHEQSYTGKCNKQIIKELKITVTECRSLKNETTDNLIKMEKTAKAYKMLYCRERKKLIN